MILLVLKVKQNVFNDSKVVINPKVAKKILTIFIGEDFSLYLFNNSLPI